MYTFRENQPSKDLYITYTHPFIINDNKNEADNLLGAIKIKLESYLVYRIRIIKRNPIDINNLQVSLWDFRE